MMITMESIVVVSMMIGRHKNDGGRNNDGRNGEGGDWSKDEEYEARDGGNSDVVMRAVVAMVMVIVMMVVVVVVVMLKMCKLHESKNFVDYSVIRA